MEPRIERLKEKKLVGMRITTSFSNNKTFELWSTFMPSRKEIHNCIGTDLYSIQIYDPLFFNNFNPNTEFEKWATIEVMDFDKVPEEMESFTLPGGMYAVFLYRGAASATAPTFQYILGTWLPSSVYSLDDRPHFEVMGEKYRNEDPTSEEEIWIPIKPNG
jgi:AraC family transcriptional regulator